MATVLYRLKHLALAALGLGMVASAQAQLTTTSRFIPPPNGVYRDEPLVSAPIVFGSTGFSLLEGSKWSGFTQRRLRHK